MYLQVCWLVDEHNCDSYVLNICSIPHYGLDRYRTAIRAPIGRHLVIIAGPQCQPIFKACKLAFLNTIPFAWLTGLVIAQACSCTLQAQAPGLQSATACLCND